LKIFSKPRLVKNSPATDVTPVARLSRILEAGKIKEFLKRNKIRRILSFYKVIQALSPYGENSYELQETKENPEFQVEA